MPLLHQDLTMKVIGIFYDVYGELGSGYLESVCQAGMAIALRESGLAVLEFPGMEVHFRGQIIGHFTPDMLIESRLIVEIKSGRAFHPAHEAQLINYLRASEIEVGLLLNFGPKPQYLRRILTNDRKAPAQSATASPQKSIRVRAIRGLPLERAATRSRTRSLLSVQSVACVFSGRRRDQERDPCCPCNPWPASPASSNAIKNEIRVVRAIRGLRLQRALP